MNSRIEFVLEVSDANHWFKGKVAGVVAVLEFVLNAARHSVGIVLVVWLLEIFRISIVDAAHLLHL